MLESKFSGKLPTIEETKKVEEELIESLKRTKPSDREFLIAWVGVHMCYKKDVPVDRYLLDPKIYRSDPILKIKDAFHSFKENIRNYFIKPNTA